MWVQCEHCISLVQGSKASEAVSLLSPEDKELHKSNLAAMEVAGAIRAGAELQCHLVPDVLHSWVCRAIAEHGRQAEREPGMAAPPMI